jgi:hypothetical protein
MPVHHIDMDPVRPGGIDGADLFAEARKVAGENRGRNDKGMLHQLCSRDAACQEGLAQTGLATKAATESESGRVGKIGSAIGAICADAAGDFAHAVIPTDRTAWALRLSGWRVNSKTEWAQCPPYVAPPQASHVMANTT